MQNAVAFADNDIVVAAWSYGHKLDTCMGFAVYRIDEAGAETPLPSMAVFPGFKRKPNQTTKDFPIQKFYWKDPYARLIADKTGKRKFRYKIVPLEGTPGALKPMSIGFVVSNEVEVTPKLSDTLSAYFNRGIISTQHVSDALGGAPSKGKLLDRVADQNDKLRSDLAGDMIGALVDFVSGVDTAGELYCALYELGDDQLISELEKIGARLHVVLSNPKASDEQSASGVTDGNNASRNRLKAARADVIDRMFGNNQIGHNKFAVQVKGGKPVAVLFGSTNWTSTGLCTQTNNTIVSRDAKLARRYLDYWKQLSKDTADAGSDPKALQGAKLRGWDAKSKTLPFEDGAELTSWFSPNTPALRKTNKATEKWPPDMKDLSDLMLGAKQAILFLAFYPGTPSIANWAAQAQRANKDLFVRGCVTNPSAADGFVYELKGTTPAKKTKGVKATRVRQDPRVISAKALDRVIPEGWKKEILNAGFAVTHDKIVVIDPFSDDCVVATGSHNLGYKASYNNDENLVIVKGERLLAEAYATHVLDIYDHFSWRWMVQEHQDKADNMLKVKPDEWQSRYFNDDGTIKAAQLRFWLSALPSA